MITNEMVEVALKKVLSDGWDASDTHTNYYIDLSDELDWDGQGPAVAKVIASSLNSQLTEAVKDGVQPAWHAPDGHNEGKGSLDEWDPRRPESNG